MPGYVKKFCDYYGIRLVYTKNKYTVLSAGVNKGIPVLRAHSLFRNCPPEIAKAIECFCLQGYIPEVLENYIKTHHNTEEYKVIPPGAQFISILKGSDKESPPVPSDQNALEQFISMLKESDKELKVSKIIKKCFSGPSIHIKPDDSILVEGDKVLELDITVEGGSEY